MYIFNKQRKRLEPTITKCQYCETGNSTSMEDNYFIPLFKENDRTNVIVYRSVKYSKIPVGIPRCTSCKSIHILAAGRAAQISWAVAIAVVILGFAIWGIWGIFGIFAGLVIGFGGSDFLQDKLVRDKGIYTKSEGAKQNEAVQDLVINGWSFTQPTA
jgi:hypothetical protein